MNQASSKPIRVGVFSTMAQADHAVRDLLATGFTKEQITVICSDKYTEEHFKQYDHQQPAGAHMPAAAATGGAIGAVLGGLSAIAGFVATGGIGLLVGGAVFAWSGAVAGGLIGAMITRGFEKELANYYDQEVTRGKILVAAETADPAKHAMLDKAEEIFHRTGAEPVSLPEG
jgi:outer membrane lipoprotein SlyB